MRRLAITLAALVCICVALSPRSSVYSQKEAGAKPSFVEGEILVKLRSNTLASDGLDRVAESIQPGRIAQVDPIETAKGGGLFLVRFDSRTSVGDAISAALADPNVEYAEPNYLIRPAETVPDDEFFNLMWGLSNKGDNAGLAGADIGATRVWDITQGSQDVVVAVVDTGADLSHPDLAANAWVNAGEVAGNNVDDDRNGFIDDINGWNFIANNNRYFENSSDDLHGTHVSGTIGAAGNNGIGVAGVAWRVKLVSVKFIGRRNGDLEGTIDGAVRAINYATALRNRGVNLRAINASWGGAEKSQSLRDAISAAGQAGILFVNSAGNDGNDVDQVPDYPVAWGKGLPTMITVAAIDRTDSVPPYSNYGHESIDVAAPGGVCNCPSGIYSTVPGGGYAYLNGTSMAAPHVTGIAALLWSTDASLTPAQVKQRIIRTAQPITALASRVVSSGRASAINALTNTIPQNVSISIGFVQANKKTLTLDGLSFVKGSTVIEVNGVPLAGTKFDESYKLANGAYTRIKVKLGKQGMKSTFPLGVAVNVTVLNTATGERSVGVTYSRN